MDDQRALNFRGGETMPRNIDDIVHTSFDPDITVLIPSSTITGEVVTGVWLQRGSSNEFYRAVNQTNRHVCLKVAFLIPPDGPGNRWPSGLDNEHTVYSVTLEL